MFHRVDTAIFDKVLSSTPAAITPDILALCRQIAPAEEPVLIDHLPLPSAVVRECFMNVTSQVEESGGELVYGWAIWEWPDVFIEAEHHAVWKTGGRLLDVTPHECPTQGILFLPDPAAVYDFKDRTRRDNVRRAISKTAAVLNWLSASERLAHKLEACSVGGEYRLSPADQRELAAMLAEKDQYKAQIYGQLANALGVNSRCFCRSGLKFKKCCARYFA